MRAPTQGHRQQHLTIVFFSPAFFHFSPHDDNFSSSNLNFSPTFLSYRDLPWFGAPSLLCPYIYPFGLNFPATQSIPTYPPPDLPRPPSPVSSPRQPLRPAPPHPTPPSPGPPPHPPTHPPNPARYIIHASGPSLTRPAAWQSPPPHHPPTRKKLPPPPPLKERNADHEPALSPCPHE